MNGLFYDALTALAERRFLGAIRAALISPLRGSIVEVGAGTGASFSYYDASTHVLAMEPDPSMFKRAEQRAAQASADVDIMRVSDLALDDLSAQSADHVVATLVLCSVEEPVSTLHRIHRVLRPGGTFVFVEHVRAGGLAGKIQSSLTPLWRRVAGNCHLDRTIEPTLQQAGFALSGLSEKVMPFPLRRLVYGSAMKSEVSSGAHSESVLRPRAPITLRNDDTTPRS